MRQKQTPAATDAELIRLGVKNAGDRAKMRELMLQTPQVSDLVRFMVRDSFDDDTVIKYQYDKDFDKKFSESPQAQALAKAAGIPVEFMRLVWRAHWDIPSYTQLCEMLHRLRPEKGFPADIAVTIEDIRTALEINDMSPGWVERLIAISYNTITRTDLLQWFVNGSIERNEVISRLQDTGYTKADAVRITDAWELEISIRRKNRSATLSIRQIVKYYIDGLIDQGEATTLLSDVISDPLEVNKIIAEADLMRMAESRRKCINGYRKRFMKGEFTTVTVKNQLQLLGLDQAQIQPIVDGWDCELRSMSKQIPLAGIRKLARAGLLSIFEVRERLKNLHYTPADVERLISDMILTESERQQALAKAATKERIALREKQEKLSKQAINEFQADIDKLKAEAEKRMRNAQDAQKRLDKAVADAKKAQEKSAAVDAATAKEQLKARQKIEADAKKELAKKIAQAQAAQSDDQSNSVGDLAGDADAISSDVNSESPEAISGIAQPEGNTGTPEAMDENSSEDV